MELDPTPWADALVRVARAMGPSGWTALFVLALAMIAAWAYRGRKG